MTSFEMGQCTVSPLMNADYYRFLSRYLKPYPGKMILLGLLLLGTIGLQLVNPQILRYFIDSTQAGSTLEPLLWAAGLFLGIAIVQQFVAVGATYFSEQIAGLATNTLRFDLVTHCLQLDMAFHNEHSPGEMIERVDGDVTVLANFFSQFIVQIIGQGLLILGIMTIVWLEHWQIGLGMTLFVLFAVGILHLSRDLATPHWGKTRAISAKLYGFLEERIQGVADIHSNGAIGYVMRNFYQISREQLQVERRAGLMSGVVQNTVTGLFVIGNALIFALGAYFLQRETITLGTVYLLFQYATILMLPLILLTHEIQDLQRAKASLQRVQSLFNRTSKISATSNQLLAAGALAIDADDLSFGYNEAELVLKQLSFQLAPKRVLGLLGRTGSGKTTLSRLLFRLYEPSAGKLAINHIDIRQLEPQALRQRIGLVTQDVQLFHASVRDNLTLFQGNIPDPVIRQAIDELGLSAWYAGLPAGLDTIIGAAGQGLSEGEAQLLAFVRVFLKDPDLIILDEASSRLDPATEQLIEKAVTQLLDQRTGIIIAHRLHTLARVDDIMILEEGRIREYGPRATLAQDQTSYFAQLLQTGLQEVLT